jgi:hypothetical protein
MDGRTAAAVLGVAPGATRNEITRAFRAKAKLAHPDGSGSDEAFIALRRAYEILRDQAPASPPRTQPARCHSWFRPPTTATVDLTDSPIPPRARASRSAAGNGAGNGARSPRRDRRGLTFDDHLRAQLAG